MAQPPHIGFAACSGTGKTTLLRSVVSLLEAAGLRVGVIKHAHHDFDVDQPGKDSYELRKAGARQMLVASDVRWALITETPDRARPVRLDELLDRLRPQDLDVVLVEGFRQAAFPKIEVYRGAVSDKPLYADDPHILAVVTDSELPGSPPGPVLDINNPQEVATFIQAWLATGAPQERAGRAHDPRL